VQPTGMPRATDESVLTRAEAAVTQAASAPHRALRAAHALLRSDQPEVAVVARRAAGLALNELHQPAEAMRELRAAVRQAERAGLSRRAGEARMSAAFVLFTMGHTARALREADRAATLLTGPALDRLRSQRGTILNRLGQAEAALREYAAALPGLVRAHDHLWEARLRNNRAVLYIERGELAAAAKDLLRARQLFRELEMPWALAQIEHNLGFMASRAGAAVTALDWYARAEAGYRAAGVPTTTIAFNRAELLLALRLPEDAVIAARHAIAASESARRGSQLAEARLVLAEAALLAGDLGAAVDAATAALRSFRRQDRDAWALTAQWVLLQARAARLVGSPAVAVADVRRPAGGVLTAGAAPPSGAAAAGAVRGDIVVRGRADGGGAPTGGTGPGVVANDEGGATGGPTDADPAAEGSSPRLRGDRARPAIAPVAAATGPATGGPVIASVAGGGGRRELLRLFADCRRLAERLAAARWEAAAIDARILAAELAVRLGRRRVARELLAAAAAPGRRQPALTRARALHARALAGYLAGDNRAALRALRQGTEIIAEYATALGSVDLRAGVAAHIADLANLGVRIAVDGGRAASVLRWSELGRGLTLYTRPAAPPDDGELAALLVDLRKAAAELRAATVAGDDPRPLLRRQAGLEAEVRDLTRRARGWGARTAPVATEELTALLGDRTLISYSELAGELFAVVCAGGRTTLHPLGSPASVHGEVSALVAALRRLSAGFGPAQMLRQRRAIAERTAARLDAQLLALPGLGDGPVVIVPTGPLHSLPWSALPTLADRTVTVVPSATLWARLQRSAGHPGGRTVAVAGPDLPGADEEVADIAALVPAAVALAGGDASVSATMAAIDGAAVAHIACHGEFRPGNPLFSTLRLADGPLTAYDLQRLKAVPRLFVLSACDAGRTAVTPGEGLLGLSASLLSLGANALIAPLVAVSDAMTRTLMVELHHQLAAGHLPAEALRRARATLPDDIAGYTTAASFVCLGGM
jgi:tetratricopeptide (TPR) repeat protein